MLLSKSIRATLFVPVAVAIALAGSAYADSTQNAALAAILKTYAAQEGKSSAQVSAITTATATADDLVYAVYQLVAQSPGATAAQIAEIAASAVEAVPGTTKTRADKNVVVARVVEAAIIASGKQTDAATAQALVSRVGGVTALTTAGKEAVVAKVIRATTGLGTEIATSAAALAGATDATRLTFNTAVLKLLSFKPQTEDPALAAPTKGTYFPVLNGAELPVKGEPPFAQGAPASISGAQSGVEDYVDKALDSFADKKAAALKLAEGVATIPSVAGAVAGGYIQDLLNGTPDATKVATAVEAFLADTKLAKAQSFIVDFGFRHLPPGSDYAVAAKTVQDFLASKASATVKGNVASGAIRAATADTTDSTTVKSIIDTILADTTGAAVTDTGLAAFAGAAAVGNGDTTSVAGDITTAVIAHSTAGTTAAKDLTKIEAIAIAVIKSIATVNPDAAAAVAASLVNITRPGAAPNPFSAAGSAGQSARATLAANLAKGAATNYTAAGAAVAGVVNQELIIDGSTISTPDAKQNIEALIANAAIKAAPKAASSIAYKIAASSSVQNAYSGTSNAISLATKIATGNTAANAGAIAAGVSLADTADSGLIAKAVANLSTANQKAAFTIANTVAIHVDVEAIGLIAKEIGGLINVGSAPKLASIGTLATSLGKAINTKPFVLWTNRVDEFGELAAELVNQSIGKGGTDAKTLASIGTAVFKAASAKLLANTGNFAVDVTDIAQDVAGAIAQTIASSSLSIAAKDALLRGTATTRGSLLNLLETAAKTTGNKALVAQAFTDVVNTQTGGTGTAYGTVPGTELRSDGTRGAYEIGARYEIGEVNNAETRIKNI